MSNLRDEFLAIGDTVIKFMASDELPPENKERILLATAEMFTEMAMICKAQRETDDQSPEGLSLAGLEALIGLPLTNGDAENEAIARAKDLLR